MTALLHLLLFTKFLPLLSFLTVGLPSAALVIRPNRTQHFTRDFLSLGCEVQDNSTEWSLRWFTKRVELYECPPLWSAAQESQCHTDSLSSLDSGVYWCQSKSGKYSHMVNITVHGKTIFFFVHFLF